MLVPHHTHSPRCATPSSTNAPPLRAARSLGLGGVGLDLGTLVMKAALRGMAAAQRRGLCAHVQRVEVRTTQDAVVLVHGACGRGASARAPSHSLDALHVQSLHSTAWVRAATGPRQSTHEFLLTTAQLPVRTRKCCAPHGAAAPALVPSPRRGRGHGSRFFSALKHSTLRARTAHLGAGLGRKAPAHGARGNRDQSVRHGHYRAAEEKLRRSTGAR